MNEKQWTKLIFFNKKIWELSDTQLQNIKLLKFEFWLYKVSNKLKAQWPEKPSGRSISKQRERNKEKKIWNLEDTDVTRDNRNNMSIIRIPEGEKDTNGGRRTDKEQKGDFPGLR